MMTERKKRSGAMLCYPFEKKRLEKWGYPVIVQPKLDGIRCRVGTDPVFRIIRDDMQSLYRNSIQLRSSTGEIITSVPHINQKLFYLFKQQEEIELDGELYCHGMSFEEIFSITSRTVNLHEYHERIEFHIFDIFNDDPQFKRLSQLIDLDFGRTELIKKVNHVICNNFEEVWKAYETYLNFGYEGIIIRNFNGSYVRRRSTEVMKFKPKKSDYYTIEGFIEEHDKHGNPKGRMGALVCDATTLNDTFNVGSGMTDEMRKVLWKKRDQLIGKICHIKYQHITPGRGVPRFPIFVGVLDL